METEGERDSFLEYYVYEKLEEYIMEEKGNKYHVIVGGNFNTDYTEGSRMTMMMKRVKLIDIALTPEKETAATFREGGMALDIIWVSERFEKMVTEFR